MRLSVVGQSITYLPGVVETVDPGIDQLQVDQRPLSEGVLKTEPTPLVDVAAPIGAGLLGEAAFQGASVAAARNLVAVTYDSVEPAQDYGAEIVYLADRRQQPPSSYPEADSVRAA